MDEKEIELKIKLKKVDELVALRTSIIYVLIVLVGGTIGLIFAADNPFKIFLVCVGFYYIFVAISNLSSINKKIDKQLKVKEDI